MHTAIAAFIHRFEEEAIRSDSYRTKLGVNEIAFLEHVWGPEFQYRFDGLKAEYPLKDYQGGERFADFVYVRGSLRLLIEVDDFASHAGQITPWKFGDHLLRQNDLTLAGWVVLRFSAFHVNKSPMLCRQQIKQAIGNWWVQSLSGNPFQGASRTAALRDELIEMALRQGGVVKPSEVARALGISRTTAMKWMQRFSEEGLFLPVRSTYKVVGYSLSNEQYPLRGAAGSVSGR